QAIYTKNPITKVVGFFYVCTLRIMLAICSANVALYRYALVSILFYSIASIYCNSFAADWCLYAA
ncbi:hypothetical protein, partial [Methylotenera oryzisoli]|uniref:hypothetical protein n=1 Tax=Methylotenera oryzisoli TaxID=2080758 RepID=UPI001ADDDEBC